MSEQNNKTKDTTIQDFTMLVAPDSNAPSEERIHHLVVTDGPEQGRMIELGKDPVTIGRMTPSHVVLRDVEISRTHFCIHLDGEQAVITDLNSTNGTFVDGKRVVDSAWLGHGSVIRIGRHQLKYEHRTRREMDQSQDFERSLEGASRYVQSMLPSPITDGPVRTEWLLLPCARLGGDALGYQRIDDDHFAMYLLDVSGHGPEAAMLAVGVMNALRQKSLPDTDLRKPAQVVQKLNDMFQMEDHNLMYFTIWYGVYCISQRTLDYTSAGHHPAFLVEDRINSPVPLRTANPAVGVASNRQFTSASTSVKSAATLYLFSDGVFEFDTTTGQRWSLEDFLPSLTETTIHGLGEPQRIYQSVQRVARRGPLEDDFTVLVVRFV